MSILEEVAALKQKIEDLKILRARLQERLDAERKERDKLVAEAQQLGIEDPSKIAEWVQEKKSKFEAEKAKLVRMLEEVEK